MAAIITNRLIIKLQEALKEKKLSVVKFATAVDIPKDRIYKWLQGGMNPKAEDERKIIAWLDGIKLEETPIQILEDPSAEYIRNTKSEPTWQALLEKEEQLRRAAESRTEDLKAYNLFLQDIVKSSLAPILQGILETREDQGKILRFEQGLVDNMHELLKQKVAQTGSGSQSKKDGAKKGTGAQN